MQSTTAIPQILREQRALSYIPTSRRYKRVTCIFPQALKNYNETTEERKNAFENLKQRDEKSAKEIETQMRKLQRIQVGF